MFVEVASDLVHRHIFLYLFFENESHNVCLVLFNHHSLHGTPSLGPFVVFGRANQEAGGADSIFRGRWNPVADQSAHNEYLDLRILHPKLAEASSDFEPNGYCKKP